MTTTLLLILSVLVIGWLTAASTAVRSVSRIWLRHWAEQGARGSVAIERYLEGPQRLVLSAGTAIALASVLTGLTLGMVTTGSFWRDSGRVVLAAVVLLIFGQIVPRAVGRRWAVSLLPYLVPALQLTDFVLGPLSLAVQRVAVRSSGSDVEAVQEPRDALEDLLREGELEGVSAGDEAAIISGVVQFGDKTAGDVMTPREEIFAVDGTLSRDALSQEVAQSGYSRVPVYEGSLDNPVGMVHVFDLIKAFADDRPLTWRRLAFAAPDTHCNELLSRMLRGQLHLALVRDADGRTLGLVTLEDLLEELVGDIRDEHDDPHPSTEPSAG